MRLRDIHFERAAYVTVLLMQVAVTRWAPSHAELWSEWILLLASSLTAFSCYRASRGSDPLLHHAWRVFALSFVLWSLVQLVWTVQDALALPAPVLSITHILYFFAFAPMFLAGRGWMVNTPKALMQLDYLQVFIAVATCLFYLFSIPSIWPDRLNAAVAFLQLMDVRNLLLVAVIFWRSRTTSDPALQDLLRRLALLVACYSLGNAAAGFFFVASNGRTFAGLLNYGWLVPFIAIGFYASWWRRPERSQARHTEETSEGGGDLTKTMVPTVLPLMVIYVSSKLAMKDLVWAAGAVAITFVLFGLRVHLLYARERQTARSLQESERRFYHFFSNHPNPVYVADLGTMRVIECNTATEHRYGYTREELLRLPLHELIGSAGCESLESELARGQRLVALQPHRLRSTETRTMEVSAIRVELDSRRLALISAVDVSDRVAMEQQLQQAQKMEAVGRLAGGIAHDFNNLLTVITGYAELLRDAVPSGRPELREIERAAHRAAEMTRQLLAFSRRQVLNPQVLELNSVVAGLSPMLTRLLGEKVRIHTELADERLCIKVDPTQLDQVLMNLAVNARDAMPSGGVITFTTENMAAHTVPFTEAADVQDRFACLRVRDTGAGIPPEALERIFDPFYTTKEVGKGTGLGLATVYGIVKQSGGLINVSSEIGQGATFALYFPLQSPTPNDQAESDRTRQSPRLTSSVLLVEDEPAVRMLLRDTLRRAGAKVIDVGTAEEAIRMIEQGTFVPDVVVTDVVMPEMSGFDLGKQVRDLSPTAAVLYISGYAPDKRVEKAIRAGLIELLPKPFSPQTLVDRIAALS